jgi:hypothetical protein
MFLYSEDKAAPELSIVVELEVARDKVKTGLESQ